MVMVVVVLVVVVMMTTTMVMMMTATIMVSGAPRGSPRLRVRVFLAQLLLPFLLSLLNFLAHLLFQMKGRRGAFRLFLFFLHHVRLRSQAWSPTFQQGVRAQPFRDEGSVQRY